MVQENIAPNMQASYNGTSKQGYNQSLNSNQNRKLTPNKVNIGLKANTSMGHHNQIRSGDMGRNFEVSVKNKSKGQNGSRSNTIDQGLDEKKGGKRKERASSTIDHQNGIDQSQHFQNNSHMINNGQSHVQVSQTGSLLIGPGGRPKTS